MALIARAASIHPKRAAPLPPIGRCPIQPPGHVLSQIAFMGRRNPSPLKANAPTGPKGISPGRSLWPGRPKRGNLSEFRNSEAIPAIAPGACCGSSHRAMQPNSASTSHHPGRIQNAQASGCQNGSVREDPVQARPGDAGPVRLVWFGGPGIGTDATSMKSDRPQAARLSRSEPPGRPW